MYVGITRARHSLHLSYCERRKLGKEVRTCEPSRFIGEMGDDLQHLSQRPDATADRAAGSQRLAALKAMLGGKTVPAS